MVGGGVPSGHKRCHHIVSYWVADDVLVDLRERRTRSRWPDQLSGTTEYDADLPTVQDLCHYWRHEFDWRSAEPLAANRGAAPDVATAFIRT